MRISHRQLEAALCNPHAWRRTQGEDRHFNLGYEEVVRLGILKFHKEGATEARAHVDRILRRNAAKLKNELRIQKAREEIEAYISWSEDAEPDVVEARAVVALSTPSGIIVSGRITRVDLIPGGYRGILIGSFASDWVDELRFPLLQLALANHYAVPVDDTSVGVQNVDGSGLAFVRFDSTARGKALDRLVKLARDLGI